MGSQEDQPATVLGAGALVRGFGARFDQAMRRAAPSKDWVGRALRGEGATRCPVRLRRLSYDSILQYGDALADLFDEYPDDVVFSQSYEPFVGFQGPSRTDAIDEIEVLTTGGQWIDEWGTRWEHAPGGVGASPVASPLVDWSSLEDYLAHRLPDPQAPGRLDGALASLQLHGSTVYFVGMSHMALFERFHFLRGMLNSFEDFYAYPRESERLLDALTDYYVELIGAWGRLPNVDSVYLTDDWGTQLALMISPEMWRRFYAARYRRLCDEAHRHDLALIFHSCGNVFEIIGDLIDVGVDVVDPLQPEAMDLGRVAREFGGKVAFSGGLSNQRLCTYTPLEARDEVMRAIDTLGAPYRNAYIVGPSNLLTPDIPLDNLAAVFEACHSQ